VAKKELRIREYVKEGKKMREEKEKTKKERKTATIVWYCCRLASLGRLTLLLRLFESKREKMRTPNVISTALAYTFFYGCVCAGARSNR